MPQAIASRRVLLSLAGLLALAASASGLTVDSLEDGPFSLLAPAGGSDSGTQNVSAATCIASQRHVTLLSNLDFSSADLSIGPFDDEIATVLGEGGAQLDLRYVPAGVDISQGGNNTHFVVQLSVAEPSGRVELRLTDVGGNAVTSVQLIGGPGNLLYPLTDFAGVDLTSVQDILISLQTEQGGDYHIRDIRVDELASADQAAAFVLQEVVGPDADRVTLWTHDEPLGNEYSAGTPDPQALRVAFPFPVNRLFMIDDAPGANWAHPVRWVFVNGDATQYEVHEADWVPTIVGPAGQRVPMACGRFTATACPSIGAGGLVVDPAILGLWDKCLYAVLISGGWTDSSNYSRYPQNLTSMYQTLLSIGFPKSQIWTYYSDGSDPLDMDNLDGDNSHFTGSDITGGAVEANIRARIQSLCDNLNPNRDVLFIYTSNHGASNGDLILWDFNSDGMWSNSEHYSPAELDADTEDCKVCRLFGIFDQCYSGAFLPMVNDGQHQNTAFYSAATANEVSWGREYLDWWEDLDVDDTSMNDLHLSVANSGTLGSTALMAQGLSGAGDVTLDYCWGEEEIHIPSDLTYWGGELTIDVMICNPLPSTQFYQLSASGLPVGGSCDVAGPTTFLFGTPNPVSVGPGQCRIVELTMDKPVGLGVAGDTACYQVRVENPGLGLVKTLTGKLHTQPPLMSLVCFEIPAEQHVFLHPQTPVELEFLVQNTGDDLLVDFELQAVASDGLAQNLAVALGRQAPGEGLRGQMMLRGGEMTSFPVSVELVDATSNIFYDLQLAVGVAGSGKDGLSVVSTIGLRHQMQLDTETQDPTPRRGVVELSLRPNPFNPTLGVSFELPAEQLEGAVLDILDARGRIVRLLAASEALRVGSQEFRWDGRDDTGKRVASGAYFVRLRTAGGQSVQKAVLVK